MAILNRNKSTALHYEQALTKHKKFQRFVELDRADAIEANDERTVEVIFSSDDDVEMWFGTEKLEHGDDNVDLSYFNARMSPLLIDHRRSSDYQVGVIESAKLSAGKGYATVRFGKGAKAEEYYQDVIDGIRSCLSVGYEVTKWEIDESDKQNTKWIATEWIPREISIVTFPADDTVGVIRSERSDFIFEVEPEKEDEKVLIRQQQGGNPDPEEQTTPDPPEDPTNAQARGEPDGGQGTPPSNDGGESPDDTPTRIEVGEGDNYGLQAHQIFEMSRQLGIDNEIAIRAVQQKQSFFDFAQEQTARLTNATINPDGSVEVTEENRYEGLPVEEKDAEQFRFSNLIAHKLNPNGSVGGAENELCTAEAERRQAAGMPVREEGYTIPGSIVSRSSYHHQQRARAAIELHRATLMASVDQTAGNLVDSELRAENLIEWLYGEFAVSRAATWLMNAKGNIAIPKQNGRTVAHWGTEDSVATESNPRYELLELSPKELRVLTPFTKTFAIQSSVDAENEVRRTLMRGLGESLDTALLYGTGGNEIAGVDQIANIAVGGSQQIDYSKADGISYPNCLEAVEKIGTANADGPSMEWITSWKFWAQAKGTAMLPNGSMPIWYNNMIADIPATKTSQVRQGQQGSVAKADHGWIGNWMHLLVAMWGGMDIVVDPFSLADRGMIRVVGFYRVDSAFAHDEAFVLMQRTA